MKQWKPFAPLRYQDDDTWTLVIVRWLSETTESRLASHLNLIPTEQTLINGKNAASNKDGVRIIKSASLKINGKMKGKPIIVEDDNDLFPTLHISSSGAKIQSGYQDINYSKNSSFLLNHSSFVAL